MTFGGNALVHTKWHISLLRYGTLFLLIAVVIKPILTILYLVQNVTQNNLGEVVRYVKNPSSLTKYDRLNQFKLGDIST